MKLLFISLVASLCVAGSLGLKYQCSISNKPIPSTWVDMYELCVKELKSQVQMEVGAAITYLSMGAHFADHMVNRPGFSKFFFEAASEERQHAIKIIDYLLMRGKLTVNIGQLLAKPSKSVLISKWPTGLYALEKALELEANVTRSLRNIIAVCEDKENNDYHLVDYLSGDFLDEQYKGQRDLAGKVTTLSKMMKMQPHLGEFLFDKKLLNGEI